MDIRSTFAAQGYAATRPATAPKPENSEQAGQSAFGKAAASFAETLQQGEEVAQAAMSGKADSQSLVQALAQTELAVETAVTVRDKVVEAYQEILRMPV
ncbi:flagellar hook-basal body complex protein FliE [Celeribacter neptunius]|uniref:Flagellar hook-basal body complex protein FliE n=1 Tax=Celeribacter neptunius TaxID=588602 RepID=A0A1I3STS1_9RHOB|nr:flagellar hook-basal body complex protein FliE [Celeribacter neptunius]SFJ61632.1 flagellar hook-basal body complex protein FliE [Celeribacter neptunius]